MRNPIVATLSFGPGVEKQWREVLFGGLKKGAHSKRYSDVITSIANHQSAVAEQSSTVIQRLGGGKWCMLTFQTAVSNIKHTVITSVRGFSAEMSNQTIMEYADAKMRGILSDLQLDEEFSTGHPLAKFFFLSGLIKMYDTGVIVCSAKSTAATRVTESLNGILAEIDNGTMSLDMAVKTFSDELERIHKAAKRRANAS